MIIYYQKSTKRILQVVNNKYKKHLAKEDDLKADDLKFELNAMFPQYVDDVDVSVTDGDVKIELGGTWDEVKMEMSAPPVQPEIELTPEQERFVELQNKFENQEATLKEVQEYLFLRDK